METATVNAVDSTSKQIHDEVAYINSLLHKTVRAIEIHDSLISECTCLAYKKLRIGEKRLIALDYLNEGCQHMKEAELKTRVLVAFYSQSKELVPADIKDFQDIKNLQDITYDKLNELYQMREKLVYAIECVDNPKEREDLDLKDRLWIPQDIKLTEFNESPNSMLVEVMSEVIEAKRKNNVSKDLENKLIKCALVVNRLSKRNAFDPFNFLSEVDEGKYS